MASGKSKKITSDEILANVYSITVEEMSKTLRNGLPPCVKVSDTKYRVGTCVVQFDSKMDNWTVTKAKDVILVCLDFLSAMFYCIAIHTNDKYTATSIKSLNERIMTLAIDKQFHEERIKGLKNTDGWKTDMLVARYTTIVAHLATIQTELGKFFELGKYNIIGKISK